MTNSSNSDAIQRILFICLKVHVYSIPPLTSSKGYVAGTWTENNNAREIFLARVRVIETSIPPLALDVTGSEKLSVDVVLEDPKTGELFAAAPYTSKTVVEAAVDSSRFYAVRVVGDGGQKATLGIGFEERSDSIDFGICLQECRKVLGYEAALQALGGKNEKGVRKAEVEEKRDWSLKEGETIRVDIGKKGRRSHGPIDTIQGEKAEDAERALFSIKPPPASTGVPTLATPTSAQQERSQKRRSRGLTGAEKLGFDDGEFGEFQ